MRLECKSQMKLQSNKENEKKEKKGNSMDRTNLISSRIEMNRRES